MNFRAKWERGPTFAEVAEALAVPTDQIIGMVEKDEKYLVMYSPDEYTPENKPRVYVQTLQRDVDQIVVKFGGPTELPGYWETLEEAIGLKMEEKHGDDKD